jgi:L,D-transpeptidase ErfK/SrfK
VPPAGTQNVPPAPAATGDDWQLPLPEEPETAPDRPQSPYLVGGESIYTVERPETLRMVAAKLGVSVRQLVALNDLDPKKRLEPGQELRFNNLKIVPKKIANGLIINIPDRTLYFFRGGKLEKSIPVAVGKANKKKDEQTIPWQTPTGRFKVTAKAKDPTWRVPPSIQAEMAEQNKKVVDVVPPGKGNPLGQYAIRTSLSGIMLHSTNLPASIYGFNSHGCIRLMPREMEAFFKEVRVNTPGEIIYRPVKLTVTDDRRVFLEVHPDIYEKVKDLDKESRRLISGSKADQLVDWAKVRSVIQRKTGVAEEVTGSRATVGARTMTNPRAPGQS